MRRLREIAMDYVFTFDSTHHAIRAEGLLLSRGVDARVMPLPSAIRAGCGLCLRVSTAEAGRAMGLLTSGGIALGDIYESENVTGSCKYTLWRTAQ